MTGVVATPLHWEDLEPGFRFQTAGRTITEGDVAAFAGLTGDYNRLHTDSEYAKTSPFGQRIAHGLLVASISVGLNTRTVVNQLLEPALLGLLETRLSFPNPTFFGDTISVDIEVTHRSETSKPDRGIVKFLRTTTNQRGQTVAVSEVTMLVRRAALVTG